MQSVGMCQWLWPVVLEVPVPQTVGTGLLGLLEQIVHLLEELLLRPQAVLVVGVVRDRLVPGVLGEPLSVVVAVR